MKDKDILLNSHQSIGPLLKKLRKEKIITQVELAEFACISRTGVVKLESGESDIKLSTLISVVNLLGFDLVLKERGQK